VLDNRDDIDVFDYPVYTPLKRPCSET
jgi:tubulin polyglutamylase TTLL1